MGSKRNSPTSINILEVDTDKSFFCHLNFCYKKIGKIIYAVGKMKNIFGN